MLIKPHPLHASAVAIGNDGLIILGPSGSGKSDLAYRLIDRGAKLIADDHVIIDGPAAAPIITQSPHHIDALELRGVGIISMACINKVPLIIAIEISNHYERSPSPLPIRQFGDYTVPVLKISAFENSAALKIEAALKIIISAKRG